MNLLNEKLESFIVTLCENQNNGADYTQRDLFSKQEYYDILSPVVDIISENLTLPIEEIRTRLFRQSNLESKVKSFILNKQLSPRYGNILWNK